MKIDVLIKDGLIVTYENNFQPFKAHIGILGDRILFIESPEEFEDGKYRPKTIIKADDKVIMPGLFNNHCHGDMTLARGMGDDLTLLEQNELFKSHSWFYDFITDEDRYISRQMTYAENLLNGVTFITENMYWSLGLNSISAMQEVGIKGALVEDIRKDFRKPDEFIEDSYIRKFMDECYKAEIIPVLGGISEEDFQKKRLEMITKKTKDFNIFHTSHLAENDWRHRIITKQFDMSPIEFMSMTQTLNNKYLGSHVVKVDSYDIEIMQASKMNVVSTPICEMKIVDGVAPISEMMRKGINVSLGTDGALWNNDNDIFKEMKQTSLLQSCNYGIRSLAHKDILRMATINGAKTYGLDKDYGSIAVGKKASLIMLNKHKISWQPIRECAYENISSNIVFNTTGDDITDVWVDGKLVVKNKKILTIDVELLRKKLLAVSHKIVEGLNEEFKEEKQ